MNAILATTDDFMLALNGTMPWSLSNDFKLISKKDMSFFRKMTKGAKIVMGYNTWKSMGEKPLPGRGTHYIITRKNIKSRDNIIFTTLNNFKEKYINEKNLWCIGGAIIYSELIPYCKEVYWNELILDSNKRSKLMECFSSSPKVFLDEVLRKILKTQDTASYVEMESLVECDGEGSLIAFHHLYNFSRSDLNNL